MSGKRSVSEIQDAGVQFITFLLSESKPDEVIIEGTSQTVTRDEANRLADQYMKQNHTGPVVRWVELKNYKDHIYGKRQNEQNC